jgi:hypothetical protein
MPSAASAALGARLIARQDRTRPLHPWLGCQRSHKPSDPLNGASGAPVNEQAAGLADVGGLQERDCDRTAERHGCPLQRPLPACRACRLRGRAPRDKPAAGRHRHPKQRARDHELAQMAARSHSRERQPDLRALTGGPRRLRRTSPNLPPVPRRAANQPSTQPRRRTRLRDRRSTRSARP